MLIQLFFYWTICTGTATVCVLSTQQLRLYMPDLCCIGCCLFSLLSLSFPNTHFCSRMMQNTPTKYAVGLVGAYLLKKKKKGGKTRTEKNEESENEESASVWSLFILSVLVLALFLQEIHRPVASTSLLTTQKGVKLSGYPNSNNCTRSYFKSRYQHKVNSQN